MQDDRRRHTHSGVCRMTWEDFGRLCRELSLQVLELMAHLTAAQWALDGGDEPTCSASLKLALSLAQELRLCPVLGWKRESLALTAVEGVPCSGRMAGQRMRGSNMSSIL